MKEATSVPALKLGIFTYPVLQAADILVHRYFLPVLHVLGYPKADNFQVLPMFPSGKIKSSTSSSHGTWLFHSTIILGPLSPYHKPACVLPPILFLLYKELYS